MSAYALVRVCSMPLIEAVVDLWSTRCDLVQNVSPTDLMFAASSLSGLKILGTRVFALLGDVAISQHQDWTTKQAMFMLHAFAKAQAVMPIVFVGLAQCLRRGLDGSGSVSTSDWVVAISAFVNTSLQGNDVTRSLCFDTPAADTYDLFCKRCLVTEAPRAEATSRAIGAMRH